MIKKTLLAAAIMSSASNIALAEPLVIGAPMPSFADQWLSYLYDGIREFDAKHDDVVFKMTDANEDPAKMLNDVDNFLNAGVDALLVVPSDVSTVKPIASKASRAGIPLIVVNRIPDEKR
jgi:inositol transport system substrate-binding protein